VSATAIPKTRIARTQRPWSLALALGLLILLVVVLAVAFAPTPFPPTRINLAAVRKSPSLLHLFGTDGVGRDVLSRVLYGGRVSLMVSTAGMCGSLLLATTMGLLVLLCHDDSREDCRDSKAWQHGQRMSDRASATVSCLRIVAIEFSMCRSGRIGGASGSGTRG
jgi:hypothetical protein